MKEYKTHAEVATPYKWDLEFLLEGKTPEQALTNIIKLYKIAIKNKDSKYESSQAYLQSLKDDEKITIKVYKFVNYFTNLRNLNLTNPRPKMLEQKFNSEMFKIQNALGSEKTRFFKNSQKLAKWAKKPEFKEYKYIINKQLEEEKHLLTKAIEEYKIKVSRGKPSFVDVFALITDSEIDYGFATDSNGKKTKITRANRQKLMEHNDKQVRKSTITSHRNAFLKHKNSLAALLYQHKRYESANIMAANHKSSVEGLIFSDRINTKFLNTLYKAVQDNLDIFKTYRKFYKQFYKKRFGEKITEYDWERPLVKISHNVTIKDSIRDVKAAFKPFGEEYNKVIKRAFDENWVDFMAVKNKLSGAYSIANTYGITKKIVLMNFTGNIRATETLAHELGHSMHSYFSDKAQKNPANAAYPIFLAEIASIFNELMVNDYFLKTITNKKTKWFLLDNIISGFTATVLRQTIWSNYEYDLYNAIDQGKPVGTYSAIANLYYQNEKKYATSKIKKFDAKKQWNAIYVPHFYYGFYVYKYAVGQLVANIFFAKYKSEGVSALQFYIKKFLAAGGTQNPLDILKSAGIDLMDPKVYKMGFDQVQALLNEWIKLGKEIF